MQLLRVAVECADEVELRRLAAGVGGALLTFPTVHAAGIAVYDDEREAVRRLTAVRGAGANEYVRDDEINADHTELPFLKSGGGVFRHPDSDTTAASLIVDRIPFHGGDAFRSVAIRLQGRLLGAMYVALTGPDAPDNVSDAFLQQLAQIVTPTLYNCLTHERFARGDRRRDVLLELSSVINSSLELDTVLGSARRVIAGLEGHRMSSICLLNSGNQTFRLFRAFGKPDSAPTLEDPTVHCVAGTVVDWILTNAANFESDDLVNHTRYPNEELLRKRGVRRYIGIPLLSRGRILGAFLFGSDDPRPWRRVEYWMYENIALQLALALDNAAKHEQLQRLSGTLADQNAYLRAEISTERGLGPMMGASPAIEALRADVLRVAPTDATVLITGETGAGKELVARLIHEQSPRNKHPLIRVDCPSVPDSMFESELFGHERGAFPSATDKRIGRFELAHDGTLLLDEIGELSLPIQSKLLRVLQDGEFERVGGNVTRTSNARIIATTNRDLSRAVEDGRFRADLYFRLNVFPIRVPPLRDRRADIPDLVRAFVSEFAQRLGRRIERVDDDSLARLQEGRWPGNIRELRHLVERAVILSDGPELHININDSDLAGFSATKAGGARSSLDIVQAEEIRRVLDTCHWVIEGPNGAAVALGLKPSTLRFRMKRLGITRRSDARSA